MKRYKTGPGLLIKDCTFTAQPPHSATVEALAKAVQANAEAISALAKRLDATSPCIVIEQAAK